MQKQIIIGIDLAASEKRPTGWACLSNASVITTHLFKDKDIVNCTVAKKPIIIAIDAPLSLPKKGALRKADAEMHKKGYHVLPPGFSIMQKLTHRAIRLSNIFKEHKISIIEVHPASSRKALHIPTKNWSKIQKVFSAMGLKGDAATRSLSSHELDAITAAITAAIHIKKQTEFIGDEGEGYIVVPLRTDWRNLRL